MKVIKSLVGLVVIFVVLSILFSASGYGIQTVVTLIFWSIICTAGISLIGWIFIGYGVGWIVFEVAGWLSKKLGTMPAGATQQPEPQSRRSLTREEQALLNYVKKARVRGMNHERISQVLTNEGWTADEINWAFDTLK